MRKAYFPENIVLFMRPKEEALKTADIYAEIVLMYAIRNNFIGIKRKCTFL